MLILHETSAHWSIAVLTVMVHFIYFHFRFYFFQLVAFCTEYNLLTHFLLRYKIMDLPLFEMAKWAILLVDIQCLRGGSLTCYFYQFISGLATLMGADIARNLCSLVCSCLNSYGTFHLFPLSILFFFKKAGCFLH